MEKLCQPQRISDEEPSLYAAVGKGNGTHVLITRVLFFLYL